MKAMLYEWTLRLLKLAIATYLVIFGAVALTLCAEEAWGAEGTPARAVPADRWGTLEPRAILGDTTRYRFNYEPGCKEPFYFDVEFHNGFLYAATGSSLEVWDARVNPNKPSLVAQPCQRSLSLWRKSDKDFYITSLSAIGDLVVVGVEGGMGLHVYDVRTPAAPRLVYQHEGTGLGSLSVRDVHTTTIAGKPYAFAADDSLGIYAYDLSSLGSSPPCLDHPEGTCPGVLLGRVPGGLTAMWLQSLWKIAGTGGLLVLRWGARAELWDVEPWITGTGWPTRVQALGPNPLDVAAWEQGDQVYLAAAHGQSVSVYRRDGTPVTTLDTPGGLLSKAARSVSDTLSVSHDGERIYLFVGTTRPAGSGPQHEYLWDVTDPTAAVDLTPMKHPDGYWGWYYQDNPTGFNNVAPYGGVVAGKRFYRAAWSVFDAHELVEVTDPDPDPDPDPTVLTFCDFEVVQP